MHNLGLTEVQITQFQNHGFVSPIDVLSVEEAEEYRLRLETFEAEYPDTINAENRNNVHLSVKCLDELAHHPVVIAAVKDLIGDNVSLWCSVLFIKEPSTKHFVSWHQDGTYMGMNDNNFVTPWIALSPSNQKTGCMSVIPGSHRNGIQQHRDTFGEDNILTRGQEVLDVDESKAVDLVLKPGQMSIHHGAVIHGSKPNYSQQRRIGYALQSYMPPHIYQTLGKNYWMDICGDNPRFNSAQLRRPEYDLDPIAAADRKVVDANISDILYHGARIKRNY